MQLPFISTIIFYFLQLTFDHIAFRYFVRLKALVKNRAHPEGSIAEGYCMEECLTFCSRFLEGTTRFTRASRNPEPSDEKKEMYLFDTAGEPIGKRTGINVDKMLLVQAHRYVLRHCDELEDFRRYVYPSSCFNLFTNLMTWHWSYFRREFLDDEKRKLVPSINLTPSAIEKLIDDHFPDWLEQKVSTYEIASC